MKTKNFILLIFTSLLFISCFEDNDDNGIFVSEINDFVWKGMNRFYVYKPEIPNLADSFSNSGYNEYLNSFNSPETLFESLIYDRVNVDKYSWITNDYIALEQQFSGVEMHNGMEFGIRFVPGSNSDLYGYVRFVLPNTDASSQGLLRGQVFYAVDGSPLTINNFRSLLSQDTYTINFATYSDNGTPNDEDDDTITPQMGSMTLEKEVYTENPVFKTEIFEVNGQNVGYLMYNRFTFDFNSALNNAFGVFAANNVQHLVLDLRYNPGGSIDSAASLGSMIAGEPTDEVFTKLQYNDNFNEETFNFKSQLTNGSAINTLNLNEVYVLALGSSASASEMIINSLRPYVNVIHIGDDTEGKSQASRTIYDSPDFRRSGANPSHTYAMQPLIAISVNKNDVNVPSTGLTPNITLRENIGNLGIIGDENEPLLAKALMEIEGVGRLTTIQTNIKKDIGDNNSFKKFSKSMYIE